MSEQWTAEPETPKRKGGLPKWFWWTCGIGCLLAVLIAAAVGVMGVFVVRQASDPEVVIPKVQQYLPCDEWPEGYTPGGFEMMGTGSYVIGWPGGRAGAMLQPMPTRGDLDKLMSKGSMANLTLSDEVEGEMEVQGRTVRTLSYKQPGSRGLRVDLTGEQPPYFALSLMGDEPPSPDDIVRFLEPFDVWRDDG